MIANLANFGENFLELRFKKKGGEGVAAEGVGEELLKGGNSTGKAFWEEGCGLGPSCLSLA